MSVLKIAYTVARGSAISAYHPPPFSISLLLCVVRGEAKASRCWNLKKHVTIASAFSALSLTKSTGYYQYWSFYNIVIKWLPKLTAESSTAVVSSSTKTLATLPGNDYGNNVNTREILALRMALHQKTSPIGPVITTDQAPLTITEHSEVGLNRFAMAANCGSVVLLPWRATSKPGCFSQKRSGSVLKYKWPLYWKTRHTLHRRIFRVYRRPKHLSEHAMAPYIFQTRCMISVVIISRDNVLRQFVVVVQKRSAISDNSWSSSEDLSLCWIRKPGTRAANHTAGIIWMCQLRSWILASTTRSHYQRRTVAATLVLLPQGMTKQLQTKNISTYELHFIYPFPTAS